MNCSKVKSPFVLNSVDNCENHGLVLSPINTKEEINLISDQIVQCIDMNDPDNNMLQIGLNFTNGKFVWSNGNQYIPEIHDQLFNEHFKPICQVDHAITYLDPKSKKLFSFCVDKHLKKLCSAIDTIVKQGGNDSELSKWYLWIIVGVVVLVLIVLYNVWYFKLRRPPAEVELIRVIKRDDKKVENVVSLSVNPKSS